MAKARMKRSQLVGFILTIFFGPFGLLYSSVPTALALIFSGLIFAIFTGGISGFIAYLVSIPAGFFTVWRWNAKVRKFNRE